MHYILAIIFALIVPGQSLRYNVQERGVLPTNSADDNDAALAKLIDGLPSVRFRNQSNELYFPADLKNYLISRPINPDRGGLRLVSDGSGARIVMVGRPDPILILGLGKRPAGKVFGPEHAFDLFGKLDASAVNGPGQRWGLRTRNDTHLVDASGPLAFGSPSLVGLPYADRWASLRAFTIEHAYDSTETGEHSDPIAGIDKCWIYTDGVTSNLQFFTQDTNDSVPIQSSLSWTGPSVVGLHRITIQLDLDAHGGQVYIDGTQVKSIVRWNAPGAVTHLAPNEGKHYGLGGVALEATTHGSNYYTSDGQFDRAFCGHALYSALRYADDGVGSPQRRLDGGTITDRSRYFNTADKDLIALLPFTDDPTGVRWADRLVTVKPGPRSQYQTTSAFAMAREHQDILLDGFGVEHMVLIGPSTSQPYGDCVALCTPLSLDLRDSYFEAGGRAIASWNGGSSYAHRFRNCTFYGNEAAVYLYYTMADFDDCRVYAHGRNTFWGRISKLSFRRTFLPDFGQPERIFRFDGGNAILDDISIDIESGPYPSRACIEMRTWGQAGDLLQSLNVKNLNIGLFRKGTPLIIVGSLDGNRSVGRVDLSGLFGVNPAAAKMSTLVRVDSSNWKGTVDVDHDLGAIPAVMATYNGACAVTRIGPSALPMMMPEGPTP